MRASDMTNEQLAYDLDGYARETDTHGWPTYSATLREAAARLRNMTVRTDNSAVIAELQRCLKVAEDTLKGSLCDISEELRKAQRKAKDTFAEIHRNVPKKTAECVRSAVHSAVHEEDNNDGFWPLPSTKEGAGDGR